ncbi:replication initiator [Streptomyces sp. NBC_01803]|uniref:replication initiator n=1 Tax=Streptomyces sp. NBC_01803 TaxID=2975946 RepID=UPI002DD8E77D|nr:replication initiator [Streptomyces sp. NBC_01803]
MSWTERDLLRLVADPGFEGWLAQIRATGGCEHPVYVAGRKSVVDGATGEVLSHVDTAGEPGGRLALRCGNRRSVVCEPCAYRHAGDTYQVVRAGLAGGKGVSAGVGGHPRLFVTLTAPGFGPVHRAGRCHGLGRASCEHGRPRGCGQTHRDGAGVVGTPLCGRCYDYTAHVLWHAHAGELWSRTMRAVRRQLAALAGISRSGLGDVLRVSFAKVAEYQKRGAVHVHAVLRLDGPQGPEDDPPGWATETVLAAAVRTAVGAMKVSTPYVPGVGEFTVRWGRQLDIHPIRAVSASPVDENAVAAYVAKYTSKSVSDSGGTDFRVGSLADIRARRVSGHVRALMAACWRLGGIPELAGLRLRHWAHTLGYRGHVLTKSRRYSTTYKELREERRAFVVDAGKEGGGSGEVRGGAVAVVSDIRYVTAGHSLAERELARGIALDAVTNRAAARDADPCAGGRAGRPGHE